MKLKLAVIMTAALVFAAGTSGPARSAEVTGVVTIDCDGWSSTGEIVGGADGSEILDIISWDGTNAVIFEDTVTLTAGESVPIGDHTWASAPAANPIALNIYGRSSGGAPWPATGSYFVASQYGSCESLDWVAPRLQIPGTGPTAPVSSFDIVGDGCAGTFAWLQLVAGGEPKTTVAPIAVPSPERLGVLGMGNAWSVPVPVPDDLVLPASVTVVAGCGSPAEPLSPTASLVVDLPGPRSEVADTVGPPTAQPTFTG